MGMWAKKLGRFFQQAVNLRIFDGVRVPKAGSQRHRGYFQDHEYELLFEAAGTAQPGVEGPSNGSILRGTGIGHLEISEF